MLSNFKKINFLPRQISTLGCNLRPIKVELDQTVRKQLENEEIKPRKHFGVNKVPISTLPQWVLRGMEKVVGDYSVKQLIESGKVLDRYLSCRKAPLEELQKAEIVKNITQQVEENPAKFKLPVSPPDPDNEIATKYYIEMKRRRIEKTVKSRVYGWQAINYDDYKSLLYLFGRAPQEYSAITKIFKEIEKRDENFKPKSFFDFGSGVGTGVWAATEFWKPSLYEYYLVDASKDMNDLSYLLLHEGDLNKEMVLRNVYHRQFLPARDNKYDIVLSAYSMFEQPSVKNRLEVVNNLWNKTENYLIFVENGTFSGFSLLNEIRDFIIRLTEKNNEDAFIFSPCPHELTCPRITLTDGTPCNFETRYYSLPFSGNNQIFKHWYSYLVIKKGKPNDTSDRWPRFVRPTLVRSRHSHCKMCTKEGQLQELIFTQSKHGKLAYRCARHTKWGDQYPSTDFEFYEKESRVRKPKEKTQNDDVDEEKE